MSAMVNRDEATDVLSPKRVPGLDDVVQIALGQLHVCALLRTGSVKCWGNNHAGQLADGTETSRALPGPVHF